MPNPTATALTVPPDLQFFDANGRPLASGSVYSYVAGTTTPLATYTDQTLSTPNPNPIILNSAGKPPSGIWLGPYQYKFIIKTYAGVTIRTMDYVSDIGLILTADLALTTGAGMIGYIQAGSGAVGSTMLAKARDIVSGAADYGMVGNGTTNCATALQAMINSGRPDIYLGPDINGGKIYNIGSTTITLDGTNGGPRRFIMAHGVTLKYSGTGTAVVVQNYNLNPLITNTCEFHLAVSKTADNWSSGADTSSIGIKVVDCSHCDFYVPSMENFWTTLRVTNSAHDSVGNKFFLGYLYQTKIGIHHLSVIIGAGPNYYSVNQNQYYGGTVHNDNAYVAGTKAVVLSSGSDNQNQFFGVNLQGSNVEYAVDCAGSSNIFDGCRFEASLRINLTGNYNALLCPYLDSGTYGIITDSGTNNYYLSAIGIRMDSGGGVARLLDFYNSSVSPTTRILTFRPDRAILASGGDLQAQWAAGDFDRLQAITATAGAKAGIVAAITAGAKQPFAQLQVDDSTTPAVARLRAEGFISGKVNIGIGSFTNTDDFLYNATARTFGPTGAARFDVGVGVAFATLPAAAAGNSGQIAYVTDSTTAVWGATITGGGANPVLAWSNGTNWTVFGK